MEDKMRTIQVSENTYAAIWANWREGDEGEEGVIRRSLGLKKSPEMPAKRSGRPYIDGRYGVEFPEGFEIFRVFKGKERRAVVQNGHWMADNNRLATSLNQLSAHIGAPTENAWMGWYYLDGSQKRLIAELRDPAKIRRRG
jgi:hypothetical protein